MIDLTREQAVKEYRKMWKWIADETEKRKTKVYKDQYFTENKIIDIPRNLCYLCEMCHFVCSECPCPVDWGEDEDIVLCGDFESPYDSWVDSYDWKDSARLAREIANLPLKEGVEE